MRGLDGRVIIVAGSSRGIGAATARRLAQEGARVVTGGINLDRVERTAREIQEAGGTAVAVQYDQADESSVAGLIAQAVDHFGAINGVHANAVDTDVLQRDVDLLGMDVAVWERSLRVDLIGYATIIRAALPHLLAAGGGGIVCTSSDAADFGLPFQPAYAAAKAGVNALVRHVASRWGREGIRANAVCPFAVTDRVREHLDSAALDQALERGRSSRLGEAEDTAALVAFLLSDDGFYVNGQVVSVNGGGYLRG